MNNKNKTVENFRKNASAHACATENGDYKSANKSYDAIVQSVKDL